MKKLFTILALSLVCVFCAIGFAACGENNNQNRQPTDTVVTPDGETETDINDFVFGEVGNGYALIRYGGTDSTINVPSHYNGKKVYLIKAGAFAYGNEFTEINIPDTVVEIEDDAFYYCSALNSVTIPDSVKLMSINAFFNSNAIQTANISANLIGCIPKTELKTVIITGGESIKNSAFRDCTELKNVTIPDSVTNIGDNAFYNCGSLASVTIGNSVTNIGDNAFYDCGLLTSITIPNSVTSIGNSAFYGCYKLVEVINKSDLTISKGSSGYGNIGYYALNVKTRGASEIVNKNGYLFYNYNAKIYLLGRVGNDPVMVLPANYNGQSYEVYQYSFYKCRLLTRVTIGNNVTSIGNNAFNGCTKLANVTIGNSVTSIGNSAFSGCPIETAKIPAIACSYIKKGSLKTIEITSGNIGSSAFSSCSSLTNVTIGNGVTSIGNNAFYGCANIKNITISNSVTSIGSEAFYGCNSLTSLKFNGTKEQWNGISKGYSWNYSSAIKQVVCTDGTINL